MEIKELKAPIEKDNIYIYGASNGGSMVCRLLRAEGIEPKGFYDARIHSDEWDGLPVKHIDSFDPVNDLVVIAAVRSFQSACRTLEKHGFSAVYKCVGMVLRYGKSKTGDKTLLPDENSFLRDYPLYADGFFQNDRIVLPVLEVFVTEFCTLKCRDCSHLIPYYKKPEHHRIDALIDSIRRLLKAVDEIRELVILGGEPLLHGELVRLIKWCGCRKEIGIVRIITNGTIVPSGEILDGLFKANGEIRISDYNTLSVKKEACQKKCEEYGVPCYTQFEPWLDMGEIRPRAYNLLELKEVFSTCPFSSNFLLLHDRVYRCAHIAHLNNLGRINTMAHDSVSVSQDGRESGELKEELAGLLDVGYMQGCQWCNGFSDDTLRIEPAIQMK